MQMPGITGMVLDFLITFGKEALLPILTLLFIGACTTRTLVYWTVKRELWFVKEFEKRMMRYLNYENPHGSKSFFVTLKRILEKTFYELFELRSVMRRRPADHIMAPSDRLFLIQQGAAYLVRDTLKYTQTLRKDAHREEKDELMEVSKLVMQNNPCFNKLFGVFPIGPLNDFLTHMAGLFIVVGIFGTFLGIMKALPDLQGLDPTNAADTKLVMDGFLLKIAFSMSTSTMGILYSVLYTVFISFMNPEKLFVEVVTRYEQNLHQLWRRCETNDVPRGLPAFDENRDPVEALAELALQKELAAADQKQQKKNAQDQRRQTQVPPPNMPGQPGQYGQQQPPGFGQPYGNQPASQNTGSGIYPPNYGTPPKPGSGGRNDGNGGQAA